MAYIRWGFTFLQGSSRLSEDEKFALMDLSTIMYLRQEQKKLLKSKNYDGILWTEGKVGSLGCYGGQVFEAEVENDKGRCTLRFLVSEQTGAVERNLESIN